MALPKKGTEKVLEKLFALEDAVVEASAEEGSNHVGAALTLFENAFATLHANLKTAASLERP